MNQKELIAALIELGVMPPDTEPKKQQLMRFVVGSQSVEDRVLAIVRETPGATTAAIRGRFCAKRQPKVAECLLGLVAERKLVCRTSVAANGNRSVVWFEA